ncbi:MAG: hypothetical protein WCC11_03170 [Gammaproteobacteria bacterium]
MKHHVLFTTTIAFLLCVFLPFAIAGSVNSEHWSYDSNGINLDHGDVIIHGNDGTRARIMPDGTLLIAGKLQAVTPAQKQQLIRYVTMVKDMEIQGERLGLAAPGFALHVIADAFDGVFSGKSDDQIDKDANSRAHDFAQKALPICNDVQTLQQIQDSLRAGIPAFKPYAVIEGNDAGNCERDINSDD